MVRQFRADDFGLSQNVLSKLTSELLLYIFEQHCRIEKYVVWSDKFLYILVVACTHFVLNHVLLFCKLLLYLIFFNKNKYLQTKQKMNLMINIFYFLKKIIYFYLYFQIDYIENMAVIDFVLGLLKVVTIVYDIGKNIFNFHEIFVFKS